MIRAIHLPSIALLAASALLAACTVMPTGPSVMAMPGPNKTADLYQNDIVACR
jgi:hypothetical protein